MSTLDLLRKLILIPIVMLLHFFYQILMGSWLLKIVGGVKEGAHDGWAQVGGTIAFEIPLFIPSSSLISMSNIGPCAWDIGLLEVSVYIFTSFLIAFVTLQTLQKLINKGKNIFGDYYWRLIFLILGWVFIPVPIEMSLVYNYTVLC
ncbi:hypothetical protein [Ornithobacterium rhinotracheale]|uniref:hypothetical protein n=1 Tax=Ornithobacterium rhinotracheale TaxID=28251 RepID=UPI004036AC9B